MSRLSPELLASIRAHQHAPDEPTPPVASLPKGVTYNARLGRHYARRGKQFAGTFANVEDALAAASGKLTGLALLEAKLR